MRRQSECRSEARATSRIARSGLCSVTAARALRSSAPHCGAWASRHTSRTAPSEWTTAVGPRPLSQKARTASSSPRARSSSASMSVISTASSKSTPRSRWRHFSSGSVEQDVDPAKRGTRSSSRPTTRASCGRARSRDCGRTGSSSRSSLRRFPTTSSPSNCSRSRCRRDRSGPRQWREWIGRVPAFDDMDEADADGNRHASHRGRVAARGPRTRSIGPEAERSLGWRHFVELTGIVSSDPEIIVRYGQTEVGRVHPLSFRRDEEEYAPILLGGRSWRITSIDWRRRIAHAAPDPRPGKSRWRGDARALNSVLCRAMRSVAAGVDVPARLTQRGEAQMASLRDRFWWADDGKTTVVTEGDDVRWWTFAGLRANVELAEQLGELSRGPRSRDNLSIQLVAGTRAGEVVERVRALQEVEPQPYAWPDSDRTPLPKFAECLPPEFALLTVAARAGRRASLSTCLAEASGARPSLVVMC